MGTSKLLALRTFASKQTIVQTVYAKKTQPSRITENMVRNGIDNKTFLVPPFNFVLGYVNLIS